MATLTDVIEQLKKNDQNVRYKAVHNVKEVKEEIAKGNNTMMMLHAIAAEQDANEDAVEKYRKLEKDREAARGKKLGFGEQLAKMPGPFQGAGALAGG